MNFKTFLFASLLFLVFGLLLYFLYVKYFNSFFNPKSGTDIPQVNRREMIYYTTDNNLYQLNPKILTQNSNDIPTIRLQSTGEINNLQIDTQRNVFYYEVLTPKKESEIWKVSVSSNSSEILFSKKTSGLENYTHFRSPKISPDKKLLGFLATRENQDDLFLFNLDSSALKNFSLNKITSSISDFSWAPVGEKVAVISKKNNKYSIDFLTEKSAENFNESDNTLNNILYLKDRIIVSENKNIVSYLLSDKSKVPITDLVSPKEVILFEVSINGEKIVFEAKDNQTKKTDLYVLNVDGSDLLQLTDDGASSLPVFSPKGDKIAFWIKKTGIYTMTITKENKQKVLNSEVMINNILSWR